MRHILRNDKLIAIVIEQEFRSSGVKFFTPPNASQQLGYLAHPQGHIIPAHAHHRVERTIADTSEVLIIKKGILRVDLYDEQRVRFESLVLRSGDLILLASGGHGFEVIEDVEMIEIKQGPYLGDKDKYRYDTNAKT